MSAGNRFLFALILLSIVLIIYAFLGTYAAMTDQQYDPFLVALGFLVLSLWISFILLYQRARRKKSTEFPAKQPIHSEKKVLRFRKTAAFD
jgi:heme A synthase